MHDQHNCLLNIERLEQRRLMAGDVSVDVTGGGDLVLNGDNASNELAIISTGIPGRFEIQGQNGTTIEGQQSVTVNGVFDDIRINLRDGDNAVMLTGVDADGTENPFDVDDVRFTARNGNDVLMLQRVNLAGQLRASMGNGQNAVGVKEASVESLRVRGGNDEDVFLAWEANVERTSDINLRGGDDAFVSLESTYQDDVRARLGSGNDFAATAGDRFEQDLRLDGQGDFDQLLQHPGADASVVVGLNAMTNFESQSEEAGFTFLSEADQAIEDRIGERYEDVFADFIR
ncbi:MAG: hypothetical protein AAGF97_09905 [Planctomycetota bacterium]